MEEAGQEASGGRLERGCGSAERDRGKGAFSKPLSPRLSALPLASRLLPHGQTSSPAPEMGFGRSYSAKEASGSFLPPYSGWRCGGCPGEKGPGSEEQRVVDVMIVDLGKG